MPEVNLPETVKREAHTLRNMAADLAKRTARHNQKIRLHLQRLLADGSAYVLVQLDGQTLCAKVIGPVGASRVGLEFFDGSRANAKLENIVDCISENEFKRQAELAAREEQATTKAAKERLNV